MGANELLKEGGYAHFLNSESLWKWKKTSSNKGSCVLEVKKCKSEIRIAKSQAELALQKFIKTSIWRFSLYK